MISRHEFGFGMMSMGYDRETTNNAVVENFERYETIELSREQFMESVGANSFKDHLLMDFDGYRRFDGYCLDENGLDQDIFWNETPIGVNITMCANSCHFSDDCSAFVMYHVDGQCYHYNILNVNWGVGSMPGTGACWIKDYGNDSDMDDVMGTIEDIVDFANGENDIVEFDGHSL